MQGLLLSYHFLKQSDTLLKGIIAKIQFKKQCAIPSGYGLYLGARKPGEFLDEQRKVQRGSTLAQQLREQV